MGRDRLVAKCGSDSWCASAKRCGWEGSGSFGALASGQTMFYDADGTLQFSGGITASRGHSGDNAGRSTITALLFNGKSAVRSTPVFGCYLGNPETRAKNGS